jgi:hypothetical protein
LIWSQMNTIDAEVKDTRKNYFSSRVRCDELKHFGWKVQESGNHHQELSNKKVPRHKCIKRNFRFDFIHVELIFYLHLCLAQSSQDEINHWKNSIKSCNTKAPERNVLNDIPFNQLQLKRNWYAWRRNTQLSQQNRHRLTLETKDYYVIMNLNRKRYIFYRIPLSIWTIPKNVSR